MTVSSERRSTASKPRAPRDSVALVAQLPTLVLNVEEAARVGRCCPDIIRRALRKTVDDGVYPPPLPPAGRHGPRGAYIIRVTDLDDWLTRLAKYLDHAA